MEKTLFGIERPEAVCQVRIEIKIPTQSGPAKGRPFRVWEGPSDTDESVVHTAICENELLGRFVRDRNLAPDGCCTLSGKLAYLDGEQALKRFDIEILYLQVNSHNPIDQQQELFHKYYETYNNAMNRSQESHNASLAKMSEAFGKMAEAFGEGLAKVAKQSKHLSKITKKLERDRANLNAALLKSLSERGSAPSKSDPVNTVTTAINALGTLANFAKKSGNSFDSLESRKDAGKLSDGSSPATGASSSDTVTPDTKAEQDR
jgi:hypothetical protein